MPIAFWLNEDIWIYLEKRKIPINPVYEKYGIDRQGCIFCTNTLNWEKKIKHICTVMGKPEMFNKFMELYRKWGIQKKKQISINQVLKTFGYTKPEDIVIIKRV